MHEFAACQWYGFVAGICGLNSINTLTLIAADRYKVISQPLRSLYTTTVRRSAILISLSWLWAAIWATPPLLGWGRYIGEGFQVHRRFPVSYYFASSLCYYTVVLVFHTSVQS